MDSATRVPEPRNEEPLQYLPGSVELGALQLAIDDLEREPTPLPAYIAGEWRDLGGEPVDVVQPHDHRHILGVTRNPTRADVASAALAAKEAAHDWRAMNADDRCAIFLKAAELLAGPWRQRLNAATMLGQSKTVTQAEIDSACELIDFWRFNAHFSTQIAEIQPLAHARGVWNRSDHRPLEGFVYAITPFNFTAIAGNLPTAPALMGNTVVWKPSPSQQLAASLTMALLEDAGLPPGVINMVPGDGLTASEVLLADSDLAGIHFTGSTSTFQHLWRAVGANISRYRSYPRLVGETGGKGFLLAHPSADPDAVRTALIRGAFEYQGQKCSAASRAYVPKSLWSRVRDELIAEVESLSMGDPTDTSNFMGALIDRRAFDRVCNAISRARATEGLTVIAGGAADAGDGWFVRPTVVTAESPDDEAFTTEYFGPLLTVYVYDDSAFEATIAQLEAATPYALTGAIFARERAAIALASRMLRFAAGNFYVNDKPTGAVVGQQPFGGGRGSGTNDKAGAAANLLRWTSPRSIKETFVPPTGVG